MAKTPDPKRAIVTYLEQHTRPTLFCPMPVNQNTALMVPDEMPLHFYRYLQYRTGKAWDWVARLRLDDEALAKIIHADDTSVHVLYLDGSPAGFFELKRIGTETVNLEYFGLMQHTHGKGLGRWFLAQALDAAWNLGPKKVTVCTCTLDHKAALPLYQKFGFSPIGQSETFIHPLGETDLLRIMS